MKIPVIETVITVFCVIILIGLGTWQLQRLEWKNALIQSLQTAYDKGNDASIFSSPQLKDLSKTKSPMAYGTVSGRLLRDKAILLGPKTYDGKIGYQLIIPLMVDNNQSLFINTGWVNDLWKDTLEERLSSLPADNVRISGLIRKPDFTSFTSKNSPENDLWFRADIDEIAAAQNIKEPYPFILYRNLSTPDLQDIIPHEKGYLPRNNHLQYALFWYAMGLCLLGVYGFYIVGLNKK